MENRRQYRLEIRKDPQMPQEMGAMISQFGTWTIINVGTNASETAQLASFLHECCHLWRDDLNRSGQTAAEIEAEAESDLTAACKLILEEHDRKLREGE